MEQQGLPGDVRQLDCVWRLAFDSSTQIMCPYNTIVADPKIMEMILLDWTRMGKTFCVAGLVAEGSEWRTVRPMPIEFHSTTRPGASRNVGWFSQRRRSPSGWA